MFIDYILILTLNVLNFYLKSLRFKKLGLGTRTHYVVHYINIQTIV